MFYTQTRNPASQGPRIVGPDLAAYNIVAEFADLKSARKAMNALSRGRIGADRISMMGPAAEEAAGRTETATADTALAKYLSSRSGSGAMAGALGGAVAGLLIGGFAAAIFGADVSAAMLLAVMLFAAIGFGAIGGFVAGLSSLQAAEPWELTFYNAEGQAMVGVHSEKPEDIDLATDILERQDPLEMYRVRPDGTPV